MEIEAYIFDTVEKSRSLDTRKSRPASLNQVLSTSQSNIGIIQSLLSSKGISKITYIGGYHIEKVIRNHPEFSFRYVENQRAVDFIKQIDFKTQANVLVLSGHIFYLPKAIEAMLHQEGVIGVLNKKPVAWHIPKAELSDISNQFHTAPFSEKHVSFDAIYKFQNKTQRLNEIDLSAYCANTGRQQDVSSLVLQGKGRALENLSQVVKSAKVMNIYRLSVSQWLLNKKQAVESVNQHFSTDDILIVRSSANSEDSFSQTLAGYFQSILDVPNQSASVEDAIESVIHSYHKNGRILDENDEVLVQEQLENIKSNGVVFTRVPDTGAPYYVLSIDHTEGDKDGVTSGNKNVQNSIIAWGADISHRPMIEQKVIKLCRELTTILCQDALDIEFGFDNDGQLALFQVRPLILRESCPFDTQEYIDSLVAAQQFIQSKQSTSPFIFGHTTAFGVMPDWNPAEMIGVHPKPLAFSIYQNIITEDSWAIARKNLGYKDLCGHPLMVNIMGSPYIDVRSSINSLIPESLEGDFLHSYVNGCLELLHENPHWHDKIEFHIATHALTPDWSKQEAKYANAGIAKNQIEKIKCGYRDLTKKIIKESAERSLQYESCHKQNLHLFIENWKDLSSQEKKIHLPKLIATLKTSGVIPFAEFARMAFIGMTYLEELIALGALSKEAVDEMLFRIPTVATEILNSQHLYHTGQMEASEFIQKYGHLRPKSYDIESSNYAEHLDVYFKENVKNSVAPQTGADALAPVESSFELIDTILSDLQLDISSGELFAFIIRSIKLRESTKFEFMKLVDLLLACCRDIGEDYGISQEDIAFIPLNHFLDKACVPPIYADDYQLIKEIRFQKKRWELSNTSILPELILHPEDVNAFTKQPSKPNFITMQEVEATICIVEKNQPYDLKDTIVLIESADPGFDWIFSHQIKGLITAFGGMASHMAIRCAEFNLPAAIGCGIQSFSEYKQARKLRLDCPNQKIEVV